MKSVIASLVFLLFTLTVTSSVCHARILYVPEDFQTIQAGIDSSSDGDTVLVAEGEYIELLDLSRSAITLASHYIIDLDTSHIRSTILNADRRGMAVLIRAETGDDYTLAGLTVCNGWERELWYGGSGVSAGPSGNEEQPTFRFLSCIFRDNFSSADTMGGTAGVIVYGEVVEVRDCQFLDNISENICGGLSATARRLTLSGCLFQNNRGFGAGLSKSEGDTISVTNCRFVGNSSGLQIGGYPEGFWSVENCYFAHNRNSSLNLSGLFGRVSRCYLVENGDTTSYGGALTGSMGDEVRIDSCNFIGNLNGYGGGAVDLQGGQGPRFTRCLFSGNAATRGGAIYLDGAHLAQTGRIILDQCTFASNRADSGGAIFTRANYAVIIRNAILFDNDPHPIALRRYWGDSPSLDVDYSLLEGGEEGIITDMEVQIVADHLLDSDPLFFDPDNGDYHLSANSPCIDSGDPDSPLDPDGTRADMGAFYFHQRDIEVDAREVDFPPTEWGVRDSIPFLIHNVGGTPLTITSITNSENMACIGVHELWPGADSIVIEPIADYPMYIYYRPDSAASQDVTIFITSNDPDEPEVTVHVSGHVLAVPSDNIQSSMFNLHSAFPNPFNGQTTIRFSVGLETAPMRLAVYGVDGRLVQELWTGRNAYPPREKSVVWNAEGLPGGVYLVRLESASKVQTIKAVLMK